MLSRGRRLLALVLLAVVVAACSGSDEGDERAAGPATTERRGPTTTAARSDTTVVTGTTAAPTSPSATTPTPTPAPGSIAAPSPAAPGPAPSPPTARPAASCGPVPARAGPAPGRPRYRLRVDVRLAENAVDGDLTVRFEPDVPTDRLVFRLWPNGPRIAGAGGRLDTGPVTVGGRPAEAARTDATTLVVRLGGTLRPGEAVEAALPWRLTLPRQVNDRVSRTGDAVRLGSFFPVLAWEPGVGWATQPPTTGFAESSLVPTADFDVAVTVPPGLGALATGTFTGSGWRATAVRDFAMSVGRFTTVTGTARAPDPVQVTVGVAAGMGDSPAAYLAKAVRALEDFGRRFGPYPWDTFTLALTPGLSGGIEYPAHVMQGSDTLARTTSHEVGHMWFYALVGNDQGRDPWLDEGLATYAEGRFENTLGSFLSRAIPSGAAGHVAEPMTYWESRQSIYYRGVYVQGAQAVTAPGDPGLIDCALRHYVARNAYRVARPADLLAALASVFPDAAARMAPYGVRT